MKHLLRLIAVVGATAFPLQAPADVLDDGIRKYVTARMNEVPASPFPIDAKVRVARLIESVSVYLDDDSVSESVKTDLAFMVWNAAFNGDDSPEERQAAIEFLVERVTTKTDGNDRILLHIARNAVLGDFNARTRKLLRERQQALQEADGYLLITGTADVTDNQFLWAIVGRSPGTSRAECALMALARAGETEAIDRLLKMHREEPPRAKFFRSLPRLAFVRSQRTLEPIIDALMSDYTFPPDGDIDSDPVRHRAMTVLVPILANSPVPARPGGIYTDADVAEMRDWIRSTPVIELRR